MLVRGLNASDFCATVVQDEIDKGGLVSSKRVLVLYSGPASAILKRLRYNVRTNWKRAQDQVTRLGASWIDDTATAKFLINTQLRNYFADFYGADTDAIVNAETKVWGFASENFVSGDFKAVATAVCGADTTRVFRKYEQAALLKNPHVEVANGRPIGIFKDFDAVDPYEAFRLFCVTELLEIRGHAQKKNTKKAWQDYRMRRKFFMNERRDTLKTFSLSADIKAKIKQQKKNILTTYSLAKMGDIVPALATTPVPTVKIVASGVHPT